MVRELSPFTHDGWPELQKFWKSPPISPRYAVELLPDLPSGLVSPANYDLFFAEGHAILSRSLVIRDPLGRPALRVIDTSRSYYSPIRVDEDGDTLSIIDSADSENEAAIITRVGQAVSITSWVKQIGDSELVSTY